MMPMLGYLVDIRHTSVYGSVYAIGDVAFCAGFVIGPVLSGTLGRYLGFEGLVIITALICFSFAPFLLLLRSPPILNEEQILLQGSCVRYVNYTDHEEGEGGKLSQSHSHSHSHPPPPAHQDSTSTRGVNRALSHQQQPRHQHHHPSPHSQQQTSSLDASGTITTGLNPFLNPLPTAVPGASSSPHPSTLYASSASSSGVPYVH